MGLREEIQKRIERKRQEIADLETRVREASSYVQALEDTIKMLPKQSADGASETSANRAPRPGSMVALAREALTATARPMHVRDLLKSMGRPEDKASRAALSGSLSAYTRRREIFTRPAPNTFGLLEFGNSAPTLDLEPPEGFGIDSEQVDES
jgi:hypothetical protein